MIRMCALKSCTGQCSKGSLRLQWGFTWRWFQGVTATLNITATFSGLSLGTFHESRDLFWANLPTISKIRVTWLQTAQLSYHFWSKLLRNISSALYAIQEDLQPFIVHSLQWSYEEMQGEAGRSVDELLGSSTFQPILTPFLGQKKVSKHRAKFPFEVTCRTVKNSSKRSFIFWKNWRPCFTTLQFK